MGANIAVFGEARMLGRVSPTPMRTRRMRDTGHPVRASQHLLHHLCLAQNPPLITPVEEVVMIPATNGISAGLIKVPGESSAGS